MAIEKIGQMTYVDEAGNEHLLFPKTKPECIPGVAEHLANEDNPHGVTIAQIGAAPAGYGYGEALPTVTGATDAEFLSNIEALCREKISFSTFQAIIYPPGSAFDGYSFIAEIWHRTDNNGNKFIKIKAHGVTATWAFQRVCYLNTWTETEWENPPMIPGEEYRTTERWNGKAVYAIAFNFGALPNNTTKTVVVKNQNGSDVSYTEIVSLKQVKTSSGGRDVSCNGWITGGAVMRINISTTYDASGTSAVSVVKYTKD